MNSILVRKPLAIFLTLVILFFISGCIVQSQPAFIPSASLEVNPANIEINNGTISDAFVDLIIIRNDKTDVNTSFVIKFPDSYENLYLVDNSNRVRLTEIKTESLNGDGAKFMHQVRIFGGKHEGTEVDYDLKVELFWNGTKINGQDKTIKIKVK